MTHLKRLMLIGSMSALALPASAQTAELWLTTNTVGNFFVCIFAGILLAFAFQFLLTNLAIATGITAIGDVSESSDSNNDSDSSSTNNLGVKVFTGLGLFMTITMSISLFFASMIAVNLSLLPTNIVGLGLGIVIWAGFILISLYFDAKLLSSMAGGLLGAVKAGLSTGTDIVSGVFGQSKTAQMKEVAREGVAAIHDEVKKEFDLGQVEKKIDNYVASLSPQEFDVNKVKDQLAELLHQIEVKEQYTPDDPEATKKLILEISDKQSSISQQDKQKLSSMIDDLKSSANAEGENIDKLTAAVDKLSPGDEAQGKEYREKLATYLKNSGTSELDPEQLKDDLTKMLDEPNAAPEVLKARISKLDRSSIVALVSSVDGMDEQKAEKYITTAQRVIANIQSRFNAESSNLSSQANNKKTASNAELQARKTKAQSAVQAWFDRMNKPELSYQQVKRDTTAIFDDPSVAPQVLKNRLNRMDRDSMVALLSNNPWIKAEQVEEIANQLEQGKADVIAKVDAIDREVRTKLATMKTQGLKQAEATRKTASAAAWWLFISSVTSAGAAALGGTIAIGLF